MDEVKQAFEGLNMPYSLDSEQSVLGAILLDPSAMQAEGMELLRPEHFYLPQHQAVFGAMFSMNNMSRPIDFTTLLDTLKQNGDYEKAGGREYLLQLAQTVPSVANVSAYAETVIDKYYLRCLIRAGREISSDAMESTEPADALIDLAEQRIYEISQGRDSTGLVSLKDVLTTETLDYIAKINNPLTQKEMRGIPTGLATLDRLIGGLHKSDLVIIGARPGMGKTSIALNIARNVAVQSKKKVAVFSLEMTCDQIAQRLLAAESGIDVKKFRFGGIDGDEWDRITASTSSFYQTEIYLDETSAITVPQMKSKLRRNKPDLVIVDYLQLIESVTRSENRVQQVSEITRHLKVMAKELNVPVIVCSQLARKSEEHGKSRMPQLSDLRESGSIEQDADIVLLLHRPYYYANTEDGDTEADPNDAKCIVAKNRHGETGVADLYWDGRLTRFLSVDKTTE